MKPVMSLQEFADCVPYTYQTLARCARKTVDDGEGLPPLDAYKDRAGRWLVTEEAAKDWIERNRK